MDSLWFSNAVVAALLLGGVLLGLAIRRNRLWHEAWRSLRRRRPLALLALAGFLAVALVDSVPRTWVPGWASAAPP